MKLFLTDEGRAILEAAAAAGELNANVITSGGTQRPFRRQISRLISIRR